MTVVATCIVERPDGRILVVWNRKLPFIPWKGQLGLRDAPHELLSKIGAAS